MTPHKVLGRIAHRQHWLATFLLIAGISVLLSFLLHPFLVRATLDHLPHSATQQEKDILAGSLDAQLTGRMMFLPVRLLTGWGSFAFLLFLILRSLVMPGPVRFRKLLSLEVHAESLNILAQCTILMNLYAKVFPSQFATAFVPFSAAAFFTTEDIVSFTLLNSLNFFTLLYLGTLVEGISIQTGCSRGKSLLAVGTAWTACTLFNIGTIAFLRDTMHLHL